MLLIPKNIKNTFLAVLFTKLYVLMINLASQLFITRKKAINKFIEAILKENEYCKKKKNDKKRKLKEDFNQVINAEYVINCLLQMIK